MNIDKIIVGTSAAVCIFVAGCYVGARSMRDACVRQQRDAELDRRVEVSTEEARKLIWAIEKDGADRQARMDAWLRDSQARMDAWLQDAQERCDRINKANGVPGY